MPVAAIDDGTMPSEMDDVMPSQADEQMPSQADEVMPSIKAEHEAQLAALNASIDPIAFAEGGVNQASQYGSGYSLDPPNLLNADDGGLTAALAGPSGPPALGGKAFNFAGQALKGDLESMLFSAVGDKEDANQQLIAAAEKMMPSIVAKDRAIGIGGTDPYEDARATLPGWQRMASGVGPGLVQTAPQFALTAVQPEIGALSFGLTPQGFDPVQAAAMMIAPASGKIVGGMAEYLAAKAGISDAQARGVINRFGSGAGEASLISAPTAYQIAQMNPGQKRDEAVQDAAPNAILASILGSRGSRATLPEMTETPNVPNAETAGASQNVLPNEKSIIPPSQKPVSEKDNLAAAMKELQDMLRGSLPAQEQQTVNAPADKADEVIRKVFPEERPAGASDEVSRPARNSSTLPATVVDEIPQPKVLATDSPAMPLANGPNPANASQIPTIRGRRPINSRYAGQVHPSGVRFTNQGFPIFSPHAKIQVDVEGLTGNYKTDEKMANKKAGIAATPDGYVWHHVEDGKTMQLIPKKIHNATRHTGGAAIIRNGGFDENYISKRKTSATRGGAKTGADIRLPNIRRLSTLHQ